EESRTEAIQRYGKYLSKNMRCAVFDWGTRCKNPKAHLEEFIKYADEELSSLKIDQKGRMVLMRMKKEAEEELARMKEALQSP
ncbi:MAG: hypothetical protein QW275_02415, partial [Candidatus Anstonellaceae archaeon]